MNFYNPYFGIPYGTANTGLFSRLLGGRTINFSSILSGTSKVVNFANQAIPLVKQVTPIVKNAKTMFKVMNEFKKVDEPKDTKENIKDNVLKENIDNKTNNDFGPTFFV